MNIVYALLLLLPGRNNHQEWQDRASAMLFLGHALLQLIAQQGGHSACLTFYLKRKRYAYGWSCAAAFRIPKLTPAAKGKIKYGVSALNKILVSKGIIDGENSH